MLTEEVRLDGVAPGTTVETTLGSWKTHGWRSTATAERMTRLDAGAIVQLWPSATCVANEISCSQPVYPTMSCMGVGPLHSSSLFPTTLVT